jgi:hypothetical protein
LNRAKFRLKWEGAFTSGEFSVSGRLFKIRFAITVALFLTSATVFSVAYADLREECIRLYDDLTHVHTDVKKVLIETHDFDSLVKNLEEDVDPHSRQPFSLRYKDAREKTVHTVPVARAFENAKYVVVRKMAREVPDGYTLIRFPSFGYDLQDEFRTIGPLKYILLDAEKNVVEVAGGSEDALIEFRRHLNGVELSAHELRRIAELNQKLLNDLRKDPASRAKLLAFAGARKWPAGLADEAGLAFFDPELFDVEKWAKRYGYSKAELIDAGWYRITFDRFGEPTYVLNSPNSIKIPYFPEPGKEGVPVWRSRNLAKDNPKLPKYTGWQIDRSVNRKLSVAEKLYNGGKLAAARGKTVIITEGEFKCLVTEKLTGIPTFGIPGITEFNDEMVQALVDAGASEYVVILDRDPHAKALFRADEITDSNRAAYSLARDLERLGAGNVRVGTLPELEGGEKLGIDDLALRFGVAPIRKTIDEAKRPVEYAKSIGLDTDFQNLLRRRSRLRKAIRDFRTTAERRGISTEGTVVVKAESQLKKINRTFFSYLENELNGARALNSASGKVNSIRPIVRFPSGPGKKILLGDGKKLAEDAWTGDLLLLDYVPSDIPWRDCRPGRCGQVAYSSSELERAAEGETPSGALASALQMGLTVATDSGFVAKSIEDLSLVALAGDLTRNFPVDEYRFEFGVRLAGATTGADIVVPVTIIKRNSGSVMAIANLHLPKGADYWADQSKTFDSLLEFLRGQTNY